MLNKISQPWPQPLFTPVQMGKLQLPSRIVMAPLTRMRAANPGHAPTELQSSVHQSANLKSIKHYSTSQENAPTYQSLRRLHSPRSVRAFQLRSWRNRTVPSFPVTKQWARSSTSALKPKVSKSASASASDGQPTVVSPVASACRATIISARTPRAPLSDATEVSLTAYVFNGPGLVPYLTRSTSRTPVRSFAAALRSSRPWFNTTCYPRRRSGSLGLEGSVTWRYNLLTNGVAKSTPSPLPIVRRPRRRNSAHTTSTTRNAMVHCRKSREASTSSSPLSTSPVPAFGLIMGQKTVAGSPIGSPTAIDRMLAFSARHSVAPVVETFPMSKVNDALEDLRAGKARYRIVLVNEHA